MSRPAGTNETPVATGARRGGVAARGRARLCPFGWAEWLLLAALGSRPTSWRSASALLAALTNTRGLLSPAGLLLSLDEGRGHRYL